MLRPNLAAGLVVILILAACSSGGGGSLDRDCSTLPAVVSAPATLTADERAALEAASCYLERIAVGDQTGALAFVSARWRQQAGDTALLEGMKAIRKLATRELRVEEARLSRQDLVTIYAALEVDAPGTAWEQGRNTRFLMLVREGGAWRVDAVATGPPRAR